MRFYNIFFSPTGGTEKVADIVAKGTKLDAEEIDLIKEPNKLMKVKFEKKDLCLVAVPSYGGRIPSVVTDMFRKVKADGTKAILVAVFGNRMIDDTLLELQDVLEASGFVCIAGMEAVAEHSLMHQFGTGRPDQQDIAGICRKDYAKQRSTKDTCISGKQTISRIWWCSTQTCCKWKMHFLRSVRKRMPGRCHSVGQSEDDR